LDPKDAKTWFNFGAKGGGTVGGVRYSDKDCYMKALELDPKFPNAWLNLGATGGGTVGGVLYSAKDCYRKARELEPDPGRTVIPL